MRRVVAGLIGLCLFALSSVSAEAKLKVFACFSEWRALAKELGGDAVEVSLAAGARTNPAHVKVTTALIAALKQADLLVCTGAGAEGKWLPGALKRANNPKLGKGRPGLFFARDFVKGLKSDGHTSHSHKPASGDPYIQGDPYRIRALAGQLARRMIALDRLEAKRYGGNTKAFIRGLGTVIKKLEAEAAPLRGVSIATQQGNMIYMLNWLKIKSVAIVKPNAAAAPGSADLNRIAARVPRDKIKFIIYAAYENPRPSAFVAERAGVALVKLPFTVGGTDDAKTFADFYRTSVRRMLDALANK